MAEDPIRRRAACDRCHSQKIKCPKKSPGQDVCDRCLKARTPCVFSPFRQKKVSEADSGVANGTAVSSESSSLGHSGSAGSSILPVQQKRRRVQTPETQQEDSIDFIDNLFFGESSGAVETVPVDLADWMSFSFPVPQDFPEFADDILDLQDKPLSLPMNLNSSMPSNYYDTSSQLESTRTRKQPNSSRTIESLSNIVDYPAPLPFSGTNEMPSFGQTFEVLEAQSESDCIRKLSQLSIDLFEHTKSVPPMSIYDSPSLNLEDVHVKQQISKYSISDTFRLTHGLVDLYPSFLNVFMSRQSPSQSSNAGTTWGVNEAPTGKERPATSKTTSTKLRLDHSSVLLILGCHLRLISLYEALFSHTTLCFSHNHRAETLHNQFMKTVRLQIGDFSPPLSTTIPMQFLLLIQLASQLFNYAVEMALVLGAPDQGTPQSDSSDETPDATSSDETLALTRATAENVKNRASEMLRDLGVMMTKISSSRKGPSP